MQDYDFWMDIIINDLDSWDIDTLQAHLDIEGISGELQDRIIKARSDLSNNLFSCQIILS